MHASLCSSSTLGSSYNKAREVDFHTLNWIFSYVERYSNRGWLKMIFTVRIQFFLIHPFSSSLFIVVHSFHRVLPVLIHSFCFATYFVDYTLNTMYMETMPARIIIFSNYIIIIIIFHFFFCIITILFYLADHQFNH